MIEYWNFFLTDEVLFTTRQKYSWLDNCAFIGGNIDFILLVVGTVFAIYNYDNGKMKVFYEIQREKLSRDGKSEDDNIRLIKRKSHILNL